MPKAVSLFLIRYDTLFAARNVRFWRKADIKRLAVNVCFSGGKRTLPETGDADVMDVAQLALCGLVQRTANVA